MITPAARLCATLAGCLGELEIAGLCREFGVEAPAGGTSADLLSDPVRALVRHAERAGRLPALIARCVTLRAPRQGDGPDPHDPPSGAALTAIVYLWLSEILAFSSIVCERSLRAYQLEPARAILDSVINGQGRSFAVMMSRQAGKNELSGQLEAYLLNLYQRAGGQIVKASPTFKPQTINSILRLGDRLNNRWTRGRWRRREGYMIEVGKARALFFSAEPTASVVGATADLLLECDEAQDVRPAKWDKDFAPMGASTNVTTVYWGTAWTSQTMLAQRIDYLRALEARDGQRRVFTYDADQVGREVPAYAAYVRHQVQRLGRQHPLIKTQYYLEAVDGSGGLFNEARRALMRGDHDRRTEPVAGHRYALLVDVAGEEEQEGDPLDRAMLENVRRDASAATVVDVAPGRSDAGRGRLLTYRAVHRRSWLGVKHAGLFERLLAMARHWHATWVVVDATGVGAGLASFLVKALGDHREGGRVLPVLFSPKVKSDLGWNFCAVVETGRYRDYQAQGINDEDPATRQFWHEVQACQYRIHPGPQKRMSWGVWEPVAYDGRIAYGHDDLLISAALCAMLDGQAWPGTGESFALEAPDVLAEVDRARW